jgi:hypothetical protein
MKKFPTYAEWLDWDDHYGHWLSLGGGTDREYEEWLEDEYDRSFGAHLDRLEALINAKAGVV